MGCSECVLGWHAPCALCGLCGGMRACPYATARQWQWLHKSCGAVAARSRLPLPVSCRAWLSTGPRLPAVRLVCPEMALVDVWCNIPDTAAAYVRVARCRDNCRLCAACP